MAADQAFRAAIRALSAALDQLNTPAMIIGGVAVIASGVPRETVDVDATVRGRDTSVDQVLAACERHEIRPRIADIREFARDHNALLLLHDPTGVPIEISFGWLPFEEEALANAIDADLEGITVRVARPEDLIIYKAAAWRDRDRSDIERLLVLHATRIDLTRVRRLVEDIGKALDDPQRIDAFDELVRRAEGRT